MGFVWRAQLDFPVIFMTGGHHNKSLQRAACAVNFKWGMMRETLIWQQMEERWRNCLKEILKSMRRSRRVTRQRQMCRSEQWTHTRGHIGLNTYIKTQKCKNAPSHNKQTNNQPQKNYMHCTHTH